MQVRGFEPANVLFRGATATQLLSFPGLFRGCCQSCDLSRELASVHRGGNGVWNMQRRRGMLGRDPR